MPRLRPVLAASVVAALALLPIASGAQVVGPPPLDFPAPVDPQSWELPEWQTIEDYRPIPGVDWNDPERQAVKPIRAAMIFGDFQDRDFVVTQGAGTDVFGVDQDWADRVPGFDGPLANPTVGGIAREDVGEFYTDLIVNEPSEVNYGHTVNEYWLEDSYGLIGVEATPFGPYRMTGKEHEYGMGGGDAGGAGNQCPQGDSCGEGSLPIVGGLFGGFDAELIQAAAADTVTGMAFNAEDYDFRWLVHAGYDESGTWQEFGEIMFDGPEAVTDRFGPPAPVRQELGMCDSDCPNAAGTRYVDWTSWAAAEGIWSHAIPGVSSTQGENDGSAVFAHELSHIFGVLDNYNNPYNPGRSYTGPWAMLSRGAFNGPGGAHTRWQIPATQGASMGSHHMLRNKIRLGFTPPHEVLTVTPQVLAATGPVAADIFPRAYPLAPVTNDIGLHGIVVEFGDDQGSCNANDLQCDRGGYDNYTVEVVDRMGHDSYTPDHGVLIAKNKTGVDLAPFMWAIDAHPEDINTVTGVGEHEGREVYDFVRPDGTRAAISLGDARQLADALFHAGTGEGVVNTWTDEANGLQFYVLTTEHDAEDPLSIGSYRVAVRSLDGHGPIDPATTVAGSTDTTVPLGEVATIEFDLANIGITDISRLSVDTALEHRLPYEYVEVAALGGTTVQVHVGLAEGSTGAHGVTLTATSELTGEAVSATATVVVTDAVATGQALPGLALVLPVLPAGWLAVRRRP